MLSTVFFSDCPLCGGKSDILYANQTDTIHKSSGEWNVMVCQDCRLLWVYPKPTREEMQKLYENYQTHGLPSVTGRSFFQTLMEWLVVRHRVFRPAVVRHMLFSPSKSIPGLTKAVGLYFSAYLGQAESTHSNQLLDIGTGNGWFLRLMSDLGWEGTGVEPDPRAAEYAKQVAGVNVVQGTLRPELFDGSSFDAVTLRHVVEHISNPTEVLALIWRVLKLRGRLVIICPNTASLGSRFFKQHWRGMEVPRHLFLYNPCNLIQMVMDSGDFEIELMKTISLNAWWFYVSSQPKAHKLSGRLSILLAAMAFGVREYCAKFRDSSVGEEIVLVVRKLPGRMT